MKVSKTPPPPPVEPPATYDITEVTQQELDALVALIGPTTNDYLWPVYNKLEKHASKRLFLEGEVDGKPIQSFRVV